LRPTRHRCAFRLPKGTSCEVIDNAAFAGRGSVVRIQDSWIPARRLTAWQSPGGFTGGFSGERFSMQ
jgi:hypothetical protein